jgi:hypothetical protein
VFEERLHLHGALHIAQPNYLVGFRNAALAGRQRGSVAKTGPLRSNPAIRENTTVKRAIDAVKKARLYRAALSLNLTRTCRKICGAPPVTRLRRRNMGREALTIGTSGLWIAR